MLPFLKKHILFLSFLLLKCGLKGNCQNLVPNPSFEDTISCPDMGGQVNRAKFWYSLLNTPDYYNVCCILPQVGVPSNSCGYQYPASGNAYMGLDVYDLIDTSYREIFGAYLSSPLQINTKYFVTFQISFSAGIFQAVNIATNKIGILFSTYDFLSSPPPINNYCQVYSDSIISDSLNWNKIRGNFIADSAYTFISVGNFFKNFATDTVGINQNNHTRGYYYIDDICISDDSMYCELWTGLSNENLQHNVLVYPNPSMDIINIENIPFDCKSIEIYDINGVLENKLMINRNFKISIDISNLKSAIYSIVLKNKGSIILKKIIHHK